MGALSSSAADHLQFASEPIGQSAAKQRDELLNCEAGIGDDAAERTRADLLVVGNYDPGVRLVATTHHVAACLATKHEANAFQGGANVAAGQLPSQAASTSTNSLPASVGTGSPASRQSST